MQKSTADTLKEKRRKHAMIESHQFTNEDNKDVERNK